MYTTEARNPCSGDYARRGLGFWTEIATIGANIVGSAIGGGGDSMSVETYYPAVKRGELLCPGPYDIDAVAAALQRHPDLESYADPVLALDGAWSPSKYGPLNARGKASALVNWAHGGRNCAVTEGEHGATRSAAAVESILREDAERRTLAAQAAAAAQEAAATAGGAVEQAAAAVSNVNPLALAAAAAAGAFLLARR